MIRIVILPILLTLFFAKLAIAVNYSHSEIEQYCGQSSRLAVLAIESRRAGISLDSALYTAIEYNSEIAQDSVKQIYESIYNLNVKDVNPIELDKVLYDSFFNGCSNQFSKHNNQQSVMNLANSHWISNGSSPYEIKIYNYDQGGLITIEKGGATMGFKNTSPVENMLTEGPFMNTQAYEITLLPEDTNGRNVKYTLYAVNDNCLVLGALEDNGKKDYIKFTNGHDVLGREILDLCLMRK